MHKLYKFSMNLYTMEEEPDIDDIKKWREYHFKVSTPKEALDLAASIMDELDFKIFEDFVQENTGPFFTPINDGDAFKFEILEDSLCYKEFPCYEIKKHLRTGTITHFEVYATPSHLKSEEEGLLHGWGPLWKRYEEEQLRELTRPEFCCMESMQW